MGSNGNEVIRLGPHTQIVKGKTTKPFPDKKHPKFQTMAQLEVAESRRKASMIAAAVVAALLVGLVIGFITGRFLLVF